MTIKICKKFGIELQRPAAWCPYFELKENQKAAIHAGQCQLCKNYEEKETKDDVKNK